MKRGYQIIQEDSLNRLILSEINKHESLSKLAKKIGINKGTLSLALHNKEITIQAKLKIAKFLNLEEYVKNCPFCNK